ncbi:helix-turn-helix domain-containing protein [Clostridium neuense]|uniref:Helix-turn-helix domain-containing protein n=1 Tax=Clostridium neuense TaxID=1728934 RepID=A0ABW8TG49_9CLOT
MKDDILTTKESTLVSLLIEGLNITDIAKQLKVTRNTIYSWMNKDIVKAELDKRKQELSRQGNRLIMKDMAIYIDNIKVLANDKSDKRVCLAANQYLLNRVMGVPTASIGDSTQDDNSNGTDVLELEAELKKFKVKYK